MVASNERGRAFEYCVRQEILKLAESMGVASELTPETVKRDRVEKKYFNELKAIDKNDFLAGAKTFAKWVETQGWLNAKKLVIERVSDDKAKKNIEMADLRLHFLPKDGKVFVKNISLKHHHNALCHPRLPSLANQAGIFDEKIDKEYRESYCKIWLAFYEKFKKLGKKIKNYKELGTVDKNFKTTWLYVPLQKNATSFLEKYANNPENSGAFFRYLTGTNDYYVLKNEKDHIEIKQFAGIAQPTGFKISYPYKSKTTFLIEFNNGWKITCRLHTASSRIEENGKVFMTEKEDPICINLEDAIKIDKIAK